jgi:hypothetical protein
MANVRKAGARMLARLAAGFCLVFPLVSLADDVAAPFPEYDGDSRWSVLPAQAAGWQMNALCAWEGYVGCTITSVVTTSTGYAYHYHHSVSRPDGGLDLVQRNGYGVGAWSCPAGYGVYTEFMGMEVGPYPNRMLEMGSGFPIRCKPLGMAAAGQGGEVDTLPAEVAERFEQGKLVEWRVAGGDLATWSVARDATGAEVTGRGERGVARARIEQGRVVSLGSGLQLEYDTEGALDTVRGLGGTVFSRAYIHDPEGHLVAALRAARHQLPAGQASEPIATLVRLGESIDALLDGRDERRHAVD